MGEVGLSTMTTKKASEYLKLVARLDKAEELLASLQNASNPKAQHTDPNMKYGIAKTTAVNDSIGNLITVIEDLKERIKYLKRTVAYEKRKLLKFANKIHKEDLRVAFRLKYITGVTWQQAAEIMGDSYTEEYLKLTIYRLFDKEENTDK